MQLVPKPKQPVLLQTAQWILDPVGYMNANFKRYGDIFQACLVWGSSNSFIMANELKAVQYLLTHDTGQEFSAPGEINELLVPFIGRQNLMLLSGEHHHRRRQLVMPAFHKERLKVYGQVIQQICQKAMARWPMRKSLNVRSIIEEITMGVILQTVFGVCHGNRYTQLEKLIRIRLDVTGSPLASAIVLFPWLQKDFGSWSPGHRLRMMAAETDRLLFAEIQERRDNLEPGRSDILSLLLEACDENGNGLSDQDLRDELLTLLVAGHDTTSTALIWAIYWIHSLPEVKQKLLKELETVSDPSDPSEFLHLPYLTAVCNETLRIYPVTISTFPRRVEVPMELCGYQLETGMWVTGSQVSVCSRSACISS